MPEFLAFRDEHGEKPAEVRERMFADNVYAPHQKIFDSFTGFSDRDERYRYLEKIGPHVPKMRNADLAHRGLETTEWNRLMDISGCTCPPRAVP